MALCMSSFNWYVKETGVLNILERVKFFIPLHSVAITCDFILRGQIMSLVTTAHPWELINQCSLHSIVKRMMGIEPILIRWFHIL
jgi:hypothetical protein